jgi:hypothetical protein
MEIPTAAANASNAPTPMVPSRFMRVNNRRDASWMPREVEQNRALPIYVKRNLAAFPFAHVL